MDEKVVKGQVKTPRAEESLEQEIAIIREMIGKVYAQTNEVEDVKTLLRVLDIVSSASARLVGLLHEQRGISEKSESSGTVVERMDRILVDMAREKGLLS
jgi:hypothetical protein